jgi:hypothetical protein
MSDNIYKDYEAPSTGGLFLALEDNKPTKLRIASAPYIFQDLYKNKETGEERLSVRYAWVVINVSVPVEPVVQILRLPVTGFKNLQAFAADDEYGDPQGYGITITRKGTGKQTEYAIVPSPKAIPLTDELKTLAATVDLVGAIKNAIPLVDAHNGKPLPKPGAEDASTAAVATDPQRDPIPTEADMMGEIDLSDLPF